MLLLVVFIPWNPRVQIAKLVTPARVPGLNLLTFEYKF